MIVSPRRYNLLHNLLLSSPIPAASKTLSCFSIGQESVMEADMHNWRLAFIATGTAFTLTYSAPSVAAPVLGKLETYRDWTIGCDNGGRCQAASMSNEEDTDWENQAAIFISREGQASAQPSLTFRLPSQHKGKINIVVDGKTISSITVNDQDAELSGAPAFAAITALAKGARLELHMDNKAIAHASLSGSAAALRYMDARQNRAGTVTALVAKGAISPKAVKSPAPLPIVRRAIVPKDKGVALWRDEMTHAMALSKCDQEVLPPVTETEVHPLSSSQSLVLVACGAGAYNFNSVPLIAKGKPGRRTFAIAKFDFPPGWQGDSGIPMLVNAGWVANASSLTSYAKGRGIGDCGSSETYVWDGQMFRLTEATAMGECRGAWDWITVYRAQVLPLK
jgi:Protein of unknown function (DUF1176)